MSLRSILQLCLLSLVICMGSKPSSGLDVAGVQAPTVVQDPTAAALPEVRLRKLHLVRPDLIPYPIFYEVFC
ncbi:MAG: hypothetical protein ACM359_11060 [Bacillota bacterium]